MNLLTRDWWSWPAMNLHSHSTLIFVAPCRTRRLTCDEHARLPTHTACSDQDVERDRDETEDAEQAWETRETQMSLDRFSNFMIKYHFLGGAIRYGRQTIIATLRQSLFAFSSCVFDVYIYVHDQQKILLWISIRHLDHSHLSCDEAAYWSILPAIITLLPMR